MADVERNASSQLSGLSSPKLIALREILNDMLLGVVERGTARAGHGALRPRALAQRRFGAVASESSVVS
jgi:hypothetical protein